MNNPSANEIVTALAGLTSTQNLRNRAFDGCSKWIQDGMEQGSDGLSGWSAEEIETHFASCSLVFSHGIQDHAFMDTRLSLCVRVPDGIYFRDLRPIGYYRLITRLDGTDEDDYFVIDVPKQTGSDVNAGNTF